MSKLLILLCAALSLATQTSKDYRSMVGQTKTMCGPVVTYLYPGKDGEGCTVRLDFSEPYWKPVFYFQVAEKVRSAFPSAPEALYLGQDVCVTGTVKVDRSRTPYIEVTDLAQVQPRTQNPIQPFGAGASGACQPGVKGPTLKTKVAPNYPSGDLVARGIEDLLLLDVVVGVDGAVTDARLLYAKHQEFIAPALEAVRRWRFKPATRQGAPVPVTVQVEMKFKLR